MNMNPKISVIVPVYNTEKYLKRCIDSILEQSFSDFELLLIDDGSTDASPAICDEYAQIDSRVRVFHTVNGGVSSARNLGLDNVRGQWVIFVDADDYWLDCNALNRLYLKAVLGNFDIVRGEYISVSSNEVQIEVKDNSKKIAWEHESLDNAQFIKNIIDGEFFSVLCIIKKSVVSNTRFDKNMVFLEDAKFYMTLLSRPLKCGYSGTPFYAYRKLNTSASHKQSIKKLSNSFDMCDFYWQMSENVENDELRYYCAKQSVMMYYWTLQTLSADPYYQNVKQIVRELQLEDLLLRTRERSNKVRNKLNFKVKTVLSHSPEVSAKILHYGALVSKIFK